MVINSPTKNECVRIVDQLLEEQPLLVSDTLNQIKKVDPHFIYFFTLAEVLATFCYKRKLQYEDNHHHQIRGVHISRDNVMERSLFIAVSLWLFSPSVYKIAIRPNKKSEKKELMPIWNAENGIRHHLSGILGCNAEWISQQINPIAFNYHGRNKEFKNSVDELVAYIKEEVKEDVVVEQEEKQELSLYE